MVGSFDLSPGLSNSSYFKKFHYNQRQNWRINWNWRIKELKNTSIVFIRLDEVFNVITVKGADLKFYGESYSAETWFPGMRWTVSTFFDYLQFSWKEVASFLYINRIEITAIGLIKNEAHRDWLDEEGALCILFKIFPYLLWVWLDCYHD